MFRRFAESRLATLEQTPAAETSDAAAAARASDELAALRRSRDDAARRAATISAESEALQREARELRDQFIVLGKERDRARALLAQGAASKSDVEAIESRVGSLGGRLNKLLAQAADRARRQREAEAELARLDQDVAEAAAPR